MSGPVSQVWVYGLYKGNVVWRRWWWPWVKLCIHNKPDYRWIFKLFVSYRGSV